MTELSTEIAYRTDFALLCNARGYVDAVEVGTDQAVFARDFLSRWRGNWLVCVDPFVACMEFEYDRAADMMTAIMALMPYHGRFRIVRMRSTEAAAAVRVFINPPGFIYIDAAHDEESVTADIAAWWPVLADGGMLAGHDYDEAHPGVVAAVGAFARAHGLTVRLTHETTFPASWYVYKGEPERLIHKFFDDRESDNPRAGA